MSIRELLEKKFFPFVIKPGRYTGGEPGQIVKEFSGRTAYLHIYPDKYEIGQSHVGLQNIYHTVNQQENLLCERAFALDADAEEIMRREEIELFSLESSHPASDFDVIGFSLVDETVYTNLLTCLDLAHIPLRAADRTDQQPLIIAGGPAVYNPEPIAPFIDLFFIGDAEEGLPELLNLIHTMPDRTREEKLARLAQEVESVYVPRFYDDNRRPRVDFAPAQIKPRILAALKPEFYPDRPLVPMIETIQSHLAVEIMRGCPQGCRFCMARAVYRPTRVRPREEIVAQIEKQLAFTGYKEVTLLSLSSSDYPEIEKLAGPLARSLEPKRVSLTLPSLRPGSISGVLLDAIKRVRRFGLTIAPEAGTERLRMFLRKDFSDQEVLDTVRLAFDKGWTTIKMYFMVGLPSETDEDLEGIVTICQRVKTLAKEYEGRKTINVTLSPFVPKPHTPFQWDEALGDKEVFSRINQIKNRIRTGQINVKHNSTQSAQLIAIISRSDRKIADIIQHAFELGCRFDGWSEQFDWQKWQASFDWAGLDQEAALKAIPFSAILPWSHICKGPSPEHLQKERERTSFKLKEPAEPAQPTPEPEPAPPAMEFGRSRKKLASKNRLAPTKNRIRLRWSKTERCRFLSHLDNMRLFETALRLAGLPVEYSQGFNPAPRLSFGPPLSLGMTSEAEYIDLLLTEPWRADMTGRLNDVIAEGFLIEEARPVFGKAPSLTSQLNQVDYQLPIKFFKSPEEIPELIEALLSRDSLEVTRVRKEKVKVVDIRPAIANLMVEDDHLRLELAVGESGFAKPGEVLGFLSEDLAVDILALVFHRKKMYQVREDGSIIDALEL